MKKRIASFQKKFDDGHEFVDDDGGGGGVVATDDEEEEDGVVEVVGVVPIV